MVVSRITGMSMEIEIEDPTEEVKDQHPETGDASDSGTAPEEPGEEAAEDPGEPLEAEVQKWRDLALRNQADLENYRKRMAREKTEAVQYANASLIRSLLPILDSFEMGLQAAKAEGEDSVIYQGMVMVRKQFDELLAEEGVETIESIGADFDPNQHEAIQQEWSDEAPEGAIIGELRRGFRLNDRLLRAANVVISKGTQPDSEAAAEEGDEA
jgi:molecular chaperone GrpE